MGMYRSIAFIEPVGIQDCLGFTCAGGLRLTRKYLEAPSLLRVKDLRPFSHVDF